MCTVLNMLRYSLELCRGMLYAFSNVLRIDSLVTKVKKRSSNPEFSKELHPNPCCSVTIGNEMPRKSITRKARLTWPYKNWVFSVIHSRIQTTVSNLLARKLYKKVCKNRFWVFGAKTKRGHEICFYFFE